jgi:nucleotide-binding universal stress UspA family protein
MFEKVLVPVDLSEPEYGRKAVRNAIALARTVNGEVRLLSVRQMMPELMTEYMPEDFSASATKELTDSLEAMANEAGAVGVTISTRVRIGGVYHEVLAEAEEMGAGLIVVGSHRPSMATYLIGSNAARIVRHAVCSVLVVRE